MLLREPIVVVLGHVDHGKTSLLDRMRGTVVAAREAGGITQQIGASLFPLEAVISTCKALLGEVRADLKVPGILFVDTPGHAAFSNMRKRGGSVADLAILVVDLTKGIQDQTVESIRLLKARRTPFLVAANKIDLLPGWRPVANAPLRVTLSQQHPSAVDQLEAKLYVLAGELSQYGFRADLYSKITSFATTLAIVPVSAKTGEGIPDLLLVTLGLAQTFLRDKLTRTENLEGVVFEVEEEVGLGPTINVIISDGSLSTGDRIALLGRNGPFVSKVRALLLPKPLDEMRDPRDKFRHVTRVSASTGIKVVAEGLEDTVPGSPIYLVSRTADEREVLRQIERDVSEFKISTQKMGVVVKASTLGSLESIVAFLSDRGVPIRIAEIGEVTKRDVVEAHIVREKDEFLGAIIAFEVGVDDEVERDALSKGVRIFKGDVMFRLVEDYLGWVEEERGERSRLEFERLTKPGKLQVLEGLVFRRSNPAIFGVEVLAGEVRSKCTLINVNGKVVGTVSQIQDRGQSINVASTGMRVAISMREPTIGRHIREGETLYVNVPESDARALLKSFLDRLDPPSQEALKELLEVQRKVNPMWAM
ncbi:MAG: translation initiation factor IF-2 [Aigarchaeota archaeon]|nr:translation initiation factor IF-2 [Aigarchaeota archaeon]MDW8093238.1 translation initiation factor IF-2 [Nitrososphaerota archaeon]